MLLLRACCARRRENRNPNSEPGRSNDSRHIPYDSDLIPYLTDEFCKEWTKKSSMKVSRLVF